MYGLIKVRVTKACLGPSRIIHVRLSTYYLYILTTDTFCLSQSLLDLFSPPEIKISSSPIAAGTDMTLTCETTLHPFRADTELQFAFYRNGWHVQGFGAPNKYTVQSVQLGDSGDYSCEVRTVMNSVRKTSEQLPVLVQGE